MITNERNSRHHHVLNVAQQMMTAARTAPKARGVDLLEIALIEGEEQKQLAEKMFAMSSRPGRKFFARDGENVLQAECVIVIGTRPQEMSLNCGHCGYDLCGKRPNGVPCAINSVDVGIAIGSACATAADLRVDTRVMFSVGLAVEELGWLPNCKEIFAIPVSASSKNPFFDRTPKE